MVDRVYAEINNLVDSKLYEEILKFHAKGNNIYFSPALIQKKNNNSKQGHRDSIIRLVENNDLPILPIDANRIDISNYSINIPPLMRHKSANVFSDEGCKEDAIFSFLNTSFGNQVDDDGRYLRPYPSGGALYPILVLAGIRKSRVKSSTHGLNGFYHYRPNLKSLDPLSTSDEDILVNTILPNADLSPLKNFCFCVIYCVHLTRAIFKYSYRGYRLSLLEIGSMYQQATLILKSIGLENRMWLDFDAYALAKIIGINTTIIAPVAVQLCGHT